MRLLLPVLAALLATPAMAKEAPRWSLAIHGGAGTLERKDMTPEKDAAYRAALQTALDAGRPCWPRAAMTTGLR